MIVPIQQTEFPAFEKLGCQEDAGGYTKERHEREDDRDGFSVLHNKNAEEEDGLENSEEVNSLRLHVPDVRLVRVLTWLLEEEQEALPELNSGHG